MRTLFALLAMSAVAAAQQPAIERHTEERSRLADLQRRYAREAEGTNEKKRLQMEIRIQRSRIEEMEAGARRRIHELNARIEANPRDAAAYAARGATFRQVGDREAAERDFSRAVELEPALEARLAHMRATPQAAPKMRPEMERIRAYIEKNEPETYYRMLALQKEGRRAEISRMFRDAEVRMRELTRLKDRDPDAYGRMMGIRDLERSAFGLAEMLNAGESADRASLDRRLTEVLTQLFELRERYRAEELNALRSRVDALARALDGRRARKSEIIARRKSELMEMIKDMIK